MKHSMKKKIDNKGILFWITGLSGSGKTTLAKKILPFVKKKSKFMEIISGKIVNFYRKLDFII